MQPYVLHPESNTKAQTEFVEGEKLQQDVSG